MEQEKKENKKEEGFKSKEDLISFAYDVGFAIMIPLVILLILGKFLDEKFGTGHLFLIIGLLLSLITTGVSIYRQVKNFIK